MKTENCTDEDIPAELEAQREERRSLIRKMIDAGIDLTFLNDPAPEPDE